MANDKFIVKNGLVTQNVDYVSPDRTQEINLELDNTGSLTWSGTNTGKIFSLSDTTSGTVFSIVDSANNQILGIGGDGSISISDSDGNALLSTSTQSLDVSGSITASSFVGDLTGNASTASTLETPRTISLSGDVTGSATFDGSSNVTISTTAPSVSASPTLTLSGDASGVTTFTDLNDATLTVSVDGGNADTLDNQNGTYYLDYNNFTNKPSLYTTSNFNTDFTSKTTDGLSEGSNNLYFTNSRVDARVGNGTLTVSGSSGLAGSGTFSANQSSNATIDISHADTSSQGSVNNSGNTYIQGVTLDGFGHITSLNSSTISSVPIEISDTPPSTPNNGTLWWDSEEGNLFVYYQDTNSGQWVSAVSVKNGEDGKVLISDNPPPEPIEGSLWWDSTDGNLYIYYIDDDSVQWVSAYTAASGPEGPRGVQGPEGPQGPQGPPGEGVVEGGSTGDVLIKNSSGDFDTSWSSDYSTKTNSIALSIALG